jgi:hypothetical protein
MVVLVVEELLVVEALLDKFLVGLALLPIKNKGGFADRLVRDSRIVLAEHL